MIILLILKNAKVNIILLNIEEDEKEIRKEKIDYKIDNIVINLLY